MAEPTFEEMKRAYLEAAEANPRAEYHGVFMGIPFTHHADGTFSWQGQPIELNVIHRKIDATE